MNDFPIELIAATGSGAASALLRNLVFIPMAVKLLCQRYSREFAFNKRFYTKTKGKPLPDSLPDKAGQAGQAGHKRTVPDRQCRTDTDKTLGLSCPVRLVRVSVGLGEVAKSPEPHTR